MKTDQQLKQEVEAELAFDSAVDETHITVNVEDRVVILSGHPSSYSEELAAERAAQRVGGVQYVVVKLRVRLDASDKQTDADLAEVIRHMLRWTSGLPEGAIQVEVEHGRVTLRGIVDGMYQSHRATRAIRQMRGVIGITNQVHVRGDIVTKHVGEQIAAALRRHATREAHHIQVTVQDGRVTLTGRIASYAERKVARGAAWAAAGVEEVIDQLVID